MDEISILFVDISAFFKYPLTIDTYCQNINIDKILISIIENINIDKGNFENIDISININRADLKNIDIDIAIKMVILKNINIDQGIFQNIDINKILYQLEFGISNRATF